MRFSGQGRAVGRRRLPYRLGAHRVSGRVGATSSAQGHDHGEVAEVIYEHFRAIYDDQVGGERDYRTSVNRVLTLHGLMFAALAFGLDRMEWLGRTSSWWPRELAIVLGVGAAALLARAFCVAINLVKPQDWAAIGWRKLKQAVRSEELGSMTATRTRAQLAASVAEAVEENEKQNQRRMHETSRMISFTKWAAVLASLFVAFSLGGDVRDRLRGDKEERRSAAIMSTGPSEEANSQEQESSPQTKPDEDENTLVDQPSRIERSAQPGKTKQVEGDAGS